MSCCLITLKSHKCFTVDPCMSSKAGSKKSKFVYGNCHIQILILNNQNFSTGHYYEFHNIMICMKIVSSAPTKAKIH